MLEAVDIGAREGQFIEASRRALQRRQQLRRALALLVPVMAGCFMSDTRVKLKHDLQVKVNGQLAEGMEQLSRANALNGEIDSLRTRAFAAFKRRSATPPRLYGRKSLRRHRISMPPIPKPAALLN